MHCELCIENMTSTKGIIIRSVVCILLLSIGMFFIQNIYIWITSSVLIAACAAILVYVIYKSRLQKQAATETSQAPQLTAEYKTKERIISQSEHEFYQKLVRAVPNYTVLQQVPLSNIVDKVSNNAFRNELFRVIDYCIVERNTSRPLLLIELNDASHKKEDRRTRDQKVKAICDAAKIKLIFFYTDIDYDIKTIKKSINRAIK